MSVSDDRLLDFDASRLVHWDTTDVKRLLAEYPELYRNHLGIAKLLDSWVDRLDADDDGNNAGFAQALREVAAHLRQGDLLPSGVLYRQLVEGRG